MPRERPVSQSEDFDVIKTLAPQTKMRMVLEIFDLGKDKKKNEERKNEFIKLMGKYHEQMVLSQSSKTPGSNITSRELTAIDSSDKNKKGLHDQIMEILRNMSLSLGLSREQRQLTEYLIRNGDEVENIIGTYFLGYDPGDPREQSELKQAMRGERYFTSPPGKENE